MPIIDYIGIDGFCVDAQSAQDVCEALDRMHTQIMDALDDTEETIARRSPRIAEKKKATLEQTMRILEEAIEKMLEIEGVKIL